MLKKIAISVFAILLIIQFFRPERNLTNDLSYDVSTKYKVPEEVAGILKVACNDCHSNKTEYPWYANIQPVTWWLNDHVVNGKKHLNFSDLTRLPIAVQNHKFEEVIEVIEENEMPLESYTYLGLHKGANLSQEQKEVLIDWAREQMTYLKATYPSDSLVMKRRQ
jgi:hypothetical protein